MGETKKTASCGIPVYAYPSDTNHSFVISFFVKSGVMYEEQGRAGITHFLEHTVIRNVNHHMKGELYSTLDRCGLEFNASTYSEMVQFYIVGAPKHFRVAADVISKVLLSIELDRREIDAERGRIKAEIRESGEKTSLAGFTQEKVFSGTPLARQIIGTVKELNSIGRRELEEHRARIMTRDNCFFYITGRFSPEDADYLLSLVDRYEPAEGKANSNAAEVPASFGKRDGGVYIKNADFTKLRFTFDVDMSKISVPELDLLYDVVLGGYSSDFFIEMSEKRALFYDLSGSVERYANIGTFSFSYELRESKLYEAISSTVAILNRYKTNPLPKERCMKAGYVDNSPMLLDDPRELNFTFAYDNHVMDLGYSCVEHRATVYDAVTPERLAECAKEIFTLDNLTLTLKGRRKSISEQRIRELLLPLCKKQ